MYSGCGWTVVRLQMTYFLHFVYKGTLNFLQYFFSKLERYSCTKKQLVALKNKISLKPFYVCHHNLEKK